MSYCRGGIYLIGTSDYLECFGAEWRVEDANPVHERRWADAYDFDIETGKMTKTGGEYETAEFFTTTSRGEMIEHLKSHRRAGHKVPRHAFRRLRREIRVEGDEYRCPE